MGAMTLVLNSNFMAVDVAGWERAISLLFQGSAVVVDDNHQTFDFEDWVELSAMMKTHDNGFVHSPNMKIAIPAVIRLVNYDKMPKNTVVFTRRNILEAYSNQCCYCGKKHASKDLNFDHVWPKSRGGLTNWENIVLSCFPCNSKKNDRSPSEAGMPMHYKPCKPKHQSPQRRMVLSLPDRTKASWQRFIDRRYWNSELQSD